MINKILCVVWACLFLFSAITGSPDEHYYFTIFCIFYALTEILDAIDRTNQMKEN